MEFETIYKKIGFNFSIDQEKVIRLQKCEETLGTQFQEAFRSWLCRANETFPPYESEFGESVSLDAIEEKSCIVSINGVRYVKVWTTDLGVFAILMPMHTQEDLKLYRCLDGDYDDSEQEYRLNLTQCEIHWENVRISEDFEIFSGNFNNFVLQILLEYRFKHTMKKHVPYSLKKRELEEMVKDSFSFKIYKGFFYEYSDKSFNCNINDDTAWFIIEDKFNEDSVKIFEIPLNI